MHGAGYLVRRPGIGDEVAGEAQDPSGRLFDAPETLDVVGRVAVRQSRARLAAQVLRVGDDRGEGIVELVDDTGDDLPERGELFGLDHVSLEAFQAARGVLGSA